MKNHYNFYFRTAIAIMVVLIVARFLFEIHFMLSLFVAGFAAFPISNSITQFLEILELEKWALRLENIHVISNHPKTGDELYIEDDDLRACCIFVPHNEVYKTAQNIRLLLEKSGNKRYSGKGLKTGQKLRVHEHIYRHGMHCNEDWNLSFSNRVPEFIKRDRKAQHKSYSSTADQEWYLRNLDYQIL